MMMEPLKPIRKELKNGVSPSETDWTLVKKTEQQIDQSDKTVGTFIYDTLLKILNKNKRKISSHH